MSQQAKPRPSVKQLFTIHAQIKEWNEHAFSKEELYRFCEDLIAELDARAEVTEQDGVWVSLEDWVKLKDYQHSNQLQYYVELLIERIEREQRKK